MFNATILQEAQREYIGNVIEVLHQNESDFLKKLERSVNKEPTNFRGRREPLEVSPNPSLSFGDPDGGILATPGSPNFNHLLIPYVWLNTGLETSYNAVMNDGKETVGDPLEQIATSTGKTLIKWLNIFASNGNGTTAIATVSARTSSAILTCDGSTDSIGCTQLIDGQRVKVYDPTGTTQRVGVVGAGTIKIASHGKVTVTRDSTILDWPSDVIAGDIIVPEGATPSVGMKGIPYIINNVGDYFGLARSVVTVLQSTITPAAVAGLSATLLQSTWSKIRQRTGQFGMKGEGVVELAMGMTQHQAYSTLLTPISFQHIGEGRPSGDIGFSSQEFSWFGTPVCEYFDWQGNRVDYLNFKYLKIAEIKAAGSMKGMPINEELQSFDGTSSNYRAAKARFWDCGRDNFSNAPHRLGAITNLSMSGLSMQKS